ncbi:MAG: cell division protein ZapA [Oscillospiraceae bacterium]|nr:cell division protein ZapA [Oscillospiraceae bacterium]
MVNRVKIEICGSRYNIASQEPEEYVLELGSQLNNQVKELVAANTALSVNDALVLCAMSYLDSYKKAEANADHMRNQLTEYLEDAARARIEVDEARREVERLTRAMEALKHGQEKA